MKVLIFSFVVSVLLVSLVTVLLVSASQYSVSAIDGSISILKS
jgi:hypothetical protein